jgi:hypothetical protein
MAGQAKEATGPQPVHASRRLQALVVQAWWQTSGAESEAYRDNCREQAISLKFPQGRWMSDREWLLKNSVFFKTSKIWRIENV